MQCAFHQGIAKDISHFLHNRQDTLREVALQQTGFTSVPKSGRKEVGVLSERHPTKVEIRRFEDGSVLPYFEFFQVAQVFTRRSIEQDRGGGQMRVSVRMTIYEWYN
jgi:hypothetical protein